MKEVFYYSKSKKEGYYGLPLGSCSVNIQAIDGINISRSFDMEISLSPLHVLLGQRKVVAEIISQTSNEQQLEQLYENMDYLNDQIRQVLAI